MRRAIEGVGTPEVLSADALKDLIADAIANVILYSGGLFGHELNVTATDPDTGAPTEYETEDALSLPEQSVIASQAALDYFFHDLANTRVSERISDEAQTWEYATSATLLRDRIRLLIDQRDKALEQLRGTAGPMLERYESFIAVRDIHVSQLIEPYVHGYIASGQEV